MMTIHVHESAVIADNVVLGKNVYIGPNCTLGFLGYQIKEKSKKNKFKPLEIGDGTIVHGNTVICQGTLIGKECRLDYHSYIGEDTIIGNTCIIEYGARIYDRVLIQDKCFISGFISNDCIIEENSIVHGDLVHKSKNVVPGKSEPSPIVKADAFIGRKAIIIGPIVIEKGTYVGAGAVVTKSTEPNKLYLGVPARVIDIAHKPFI